MRVLIVEDEAPAARRLRRLVGEALALDAENMTHAETLGAAQELIAHEVFDLLLLDLDLSGRDGFDILRRAHSGRIATIIVSANTGRALEAFDHDVVDFIAKPVSAERLARALVRARDAQSDEIRLALHRHGGVDIVAVKDIIRLSGADDYVEIATRDGRRFLHDENLQTLEKRLPPFFIRVHRSHIANILLVTRLDATDGNQCILMTENGEKIPVSRRRRAKVKAALADRSHI